MSRDKRGEERLFLNSYPNFGKGRILKIEMLENLRDYPRMMIDLYFSAYSDGIIAGTDIRVEENDLVITKGIVKHQGHIYLLASDFSIPYEATGKETLIKMRFHEKDQQPDFTVFETEIVLDEDIKIAENELELGRFKLKLGAQLRSTYENFLDFATEYNTVNYIHCQYAGFQTSTFHPFPLQQFAKELLESELSNAYDIAFSLQCLNQERIQREVIIHYLANRSGTGYRVYTNEQIHQHLSRIISESKGGNRAMSAQTRRGPRRMIVD